MQNKSWYIDLFTEKCLALDTRPDDLIKKEGEALIYFLGLEKGQRILDLCFFNGRHILMLLENGYNVEGLDFSKDYCNYVYSKLKEKNIVTTLYNIDMREMNFVNKYDAVFNIFTSFGYFEEDDNARVLHNIYNALKPGGKFLLEQIAKSFVLKRNKPKIEIRKTEDSNLLFIYPRWFNHDADRYEGQYILCHLKPLDVGYFNFSVKLYEKKEIEAILKEIGFIIDGVWGDWDKSPYNQDSKRMIVLAKKGNVQ